MQSCKNPLRPLKGELIMEEIEAKIVVMIIF